MKESSIQKDILISNNNFSKREGDALKEINELSKITNENNSYNYIHDKILENPSNNTYCKNNYNSINLGGINNGKNLNRTNNEPLKYKKYNLYDISKELDNEEKTNFNNFYDINKINSLNNKNLLKINSYRDIHYNSDFHINLNNEIEKNKLKLENEKLIKENISIKKELSDALNQINSIKEKPFSLNPNNDELNNQLSFLQNKIAIYEISLEKTKNKYENQINYYIEQLANYNNLIAIINSFFRIISEKYIPNYNFNIQNNTSDIHTVPLIKNDFEEKFKIIEIYISNLNSELNKYKSKNTNFESSLLNQNLSEIKTETKDDQFKLNKNIEEIKDNDNSNYNNIKDSSFIKTNNAFSIGANIFENEIIAKKIRANSSTKAKTNIIKKEIKKSNSFMKNKKSKKEKNSKRKDSRNNENKNNKDIIKYSRKNYKTFKNSKDLPTRDKKRSKSKTKNKNK